MPTYEFECKKCKSEYEEFVPYDATGKYKGVKCPSCGSKSKKKLMPSKVAIGGPTSSKMDNFGYRAGFNMDKAQGERRAAEAASHMGTQPFNDIDDTPMGEGIHDLI